MSANETINRLVAMATFTPALTTGGVVVGRTVGVDQTFAGSQQGVTRFGAGQYFVQLTDALKGPSPLPTDSNAIVLCTCDTGFIAQGEITAAGDAVFLTIRSLAGALSDTPTVALCVFKYPAD